MDETAKSNDAIGEAPAMNISSNNPRLSSRARRKEKRMTKHLSDNVIIRSRTRSSVRKRTDRIISSIIASSGTAATSENLSTRSDLSNNKLKNDRTVPNRKKKKLKSRCASISADPKSSANVCYEISEKKKAGRKRKASDRENTNDKSRLGGKTCLSSDSMKRSRKKARITNQKSETKLNGKGNRANSRRRKSANVTTIAEPVLEKPIQEIMDLRRRNIKKFNGGRGNARFIKMAFWRTLYPQLKERGWVQIQVNKCKSDDFGSMYFIPKGVSKWRKSFRWLSTMTEVIDFVANNDKYEEVYDRFEEDYEMLRNRKIPRSNNQRKQLNFTRNMFPQKTVRVGSEYQVTNLPEATEYIKGQSECNVEKISVQPSKLNMESATSSSWSENEAKEYHTAIIEADKEFDVVAAKIGKSMRLLGLIPEDEKQNTGVNDSIEPADTAGNSLDPIIRYSQCEQAKKSYFVEPANISSDSSQCSLPTMEKVAAIRRGNCSGKSEDETSYVDLNKNNANRSQTSIVSVSSQLKDRANGKLVQEGLDVIYNLEINKKNPLSSICKTSGRANEQMSSQDQAVAHQRPPVFSEPEADEVNVIEKSIKAPTDPMLVDQSQSFVESHRKIDVGCRKVDTCDIDEVKTLSSNCNMNHLTTNLKVRENLKFVENINHRANIDMPLYTTANRLSGTSHDKISFSDRVSSRDYEYLIKESSKLSRANPVDMIRLRSCNKSHGKSEKNHHQTGLDNTCMSSANRNLKHVPTYLKVRANGRLVKSSYGKKSGNLCHSNKECRYSNKDEVKYKKPLASPIRRSRHKSISESSLATNFKVRVNGKLVRAPRGKYGYSRRETLKSKQTKKTVEVSQKNQNENGSIGSNFLSTKRLTLQSVNDQNWTASVKDFDSDLCANRSFKVKLKLNLNSSSNMNVPFPNTNLLVELPRTFMENRASSKHNSFAQIQTNTYSEGKQNDVKEDITNVSMKTNIVKSMLPISSHSHKTSYGRVAGQGINENLILQLKPIGNIKKKSLERLDTMSRYSSTAMPSRSTILPESIITTLSSDLDGQESAFSTNFKTKSLENHLAFPHDNRANDHYFIDTQFSHNGKDSRPDRNDEAFLPTNQHTIVGINLGTGRVSAFQKAGNVPSASQFLSTRDNAQTHIEKYNKKAQERITDNDEMSSNTTAPSVETSDSNVDSLEEKCCADKEHPSFSSSCFVDIQPVIEQRHDSLAGTLFCFQ